MQETSPDPDAGKSDWRQWFRSVLSDVADPDGQSAHIRRQLAAHLSIQPARCVAVFSALPGEPSLLELIGLHPGHRWVLPRVAGAGLEFHQVDRLDQLRPGAFGIAEPTPDLPLVAPGEIEVFLCPGLGFDRQGVRLGRGKGFYDRALAASQASAERIGIAFHEQVVERLPDDPHDMPMHLVIPGSGNPIYPERSNRH